MPYELEISYFNTFILSNSKTEVDGEGDLTQPDVIDGSWYVEESRIKGRYNGTNVDYGVAAHATDTDYESRLEFNSWIFSGIYNPRTGVNRTNEFPTGADIRGFLDPKYGSIQKLFAEDNDLYIFQESKILRALIDKDALYTAAGGQLITSSNKVIGPVTPYQAANGISKRPETHAYNNGRQYFLDEDRGSVLRLSRDGITNISEYGVESFIRDNVKKANFFRGMFDERRSEYVLCIGNKDEANNSIQNGLVKNDLGQLSKANYITLGFYEPGNGWSSFYTYKPYFGFSFQNEFYTYSKFDLHKHYSKLVPQCSFHGNEQDPAYITLVMNDSVSVVKNFLTVGYEGEPGWEVYNLNCEKYRIEGYDSVSESGYPIPKNGTTFINDFGEEVQYGFNKKENEYFAEIRRSRNDEFNDFSYFETSGLKGHYLELTIMNWPNNEQIYSSDYPGSIFSISSEIVLSSQ